VHLVGEGASGEGEAFVENLERAGGLDTDEVLTAVHNLSGTAAMIGATRLRNSLTQLETKLRQQGTVEWGMWTDALRILWAETRDALVEYADTLSTSKRA
jgi:HPt (histidine-containing phosphotransfer) domain-containing protein